jgi:hypothetical protein
MKVKPFLLAVTSVFLLATNSAWAVCYNEFGASQQYAALDTQVDSWQAYLESYGLPVLKNAAGILAYGDTVTNGNDRVLNARHKADVSTIFVKNVAGDFIRVATSGTRWC